MSNYVLDGIMGLCVGDALGVPVEFMERGKLTKKPVVDMCEFGSHNLPKGTWSDDTSMTLCLVDSLSNGINYNDIMDKFSLWLNKNEYTADGVVFDVGITTKKSISNYADGIAPIKCGGQSEYDNGNGSLMRILPLSFYLYQMFGTDIANDDAMTIIHNVSSLTHGHKRSLIACGIYINIAVFIIRNGNLQNCIKAGIDQAFSFYESNAEYREELYNFNRLLDVNFAELQESQIRSSGYVVDTLEAAIWCLLTTIDYKNCVLKAVNLGEDTDTVGAVVGGLAGIYYGERNIPYEWKEIIRKKEYIELLCQNLYNSLSGIYDNVFSYIRYLDEVDIKESCNWEGGESDEDGIITIPFPVYNIKIDEFINDVYKTNLMTNNYLGYIKEKVPENSTFEDIIETADLSLCKAILTDYIRKERFCDGVWADAVKNKVFLRLLMRIKDLI